MKIAFSFVGGAHQLLHGVPVAAALSRRPGVQVEAYVPTGDIAAALGRMLARLDGERVRIIEMRLPGLLERRTRDGGAAPQKILRLAWWSRRMRAGDAVVALERTSALLRRLPGRCPLLIQIPHGAGDRAKGYDRRFRLFDVALVAGEKDRDRLVELKLLRPNQIDVVGYIKLSALRKLDGIRCPAFCDPDRPTVLYNPHFDTGLSSWNQAPAIIDAIVADGRWNLIVAPHVRLLSGAPAAERAAWEGRSIPGRLLIDAGSERCIDMSYTQAADLYLGDVSSQVYEFCARPRPCIFLNTHGVDWQDDPHYAMWHLGQVVERASEVVPALERANAMQAPFARRQEEAVRRSLGDPAMPADEIAADCVIRRVGERR